MELVHGGDTYGAARNSERCEDELLDFSANINPLGIAKGVQEAVISNFQKVLHYPDPLCRNLRTAIGTALAIEPEKILCGNGGADLLYRFAYSQKFQKALLMAPTFAEYEEAFVQAGTSCSFYELSSKMEIEEDYLEYLEKSIDVIVLCNPNNPTGLLTKRDFLLKVLEKAKKLGIVVLLDECFLDFVEEEETYTLTKYLNEFENLVILKSFTKMYAIPGLRLGYVLSSNGKLLEEMRVAGQPWSVSEPARIAGEAAILEVEYQKRTIEYIKTERTYLQSELKKLGLLVYDGNANYLCFLAKGEENLYEKLLAFGIVIRRCGNYRNLTREHYRIAVRTRRENEILIEGLKKVL